jgi:hypothetical protein
MVLYYIGMHRAGVGIGLATCCTRCRGFLIQVLFWVLPELMQAMFAAKMIVFVRIVVVVLGITRYHHITDGIFYLLLFCA